MARKHVKIAKRTVKYAKIHAEMAHATPVKIVLRAQTIAEHVRPAEMAHATQVKVVQTVRMIAEFVRMFAEMARVMQVKIAIHAVMIVATVPAIAEMELLIHLLSNATMEAMRMAMAVQIVARLNKLVATALWNLARAVTMVEPVLQEVTSAQIAHYKLPVRTADSVESALHRMAMDAVPYVELNSAKL